MRSVISMPAGVARMPLPVFLLWSALGTLGWSALLLSLGFALESRYDEAHRAMSTLDVAILVVVAMIGVYLAGSSLE